MGGFFILNIMENILNIILHALLTFIHYMINIYLKAFHILSRDRGGVVTITIIIERKSQYTMFNIFRIKNRINIQIEEYVDFKSKKSKFIAQRQKIEIDKFIDSVGCKTVGEITGSHISQYHGILVRENSRFFSIQAMQAIRAFIRFHKNDTDLIADCITDYGIINMKNVGRKVIEIPQVVKKLGRPKNVELAKRIKRLRDNEKLSFRAISKALGKDVKNIHTMYKYDI